MSQTYFSYLNECLRNDPKFVKYFYPLKSLFWMSFPEIWPMLRNFANKG